MILRKRDEAVRRANGILNEAMPGIPAGAVEAAYDYPVWKVSIRMNIGDRRIGAINLDARTGELISMEIEGRSGNDLMSKKLRTCKRCERKLSLREMHITRAYYYGTHGSVLIVHVTCPFCRKALRPLRFNRRAHRDECDKYIRKRGVTPEIYRLKR